MTLLHGDCLEQMKTLADNSVDAVVTDPPYGLSFMGKRWDYDVPSVDVWREVFRVMKPGAHLLSFGGTRTYHRMVVAIEDAGFEIKDQLQWNFGSGFPKSLDPRKSGIKQGIACACENDDEKERRPNTVDVSNLSNNLATENSLPGRPKQDLLETLRSSLVVEATQGQGAASDQNNSDKMCSLLQDGDQAECLAQAGKDPSMQSQMQRSIARPRLGEARPQGTQSADGTELSERGAQNVGPQKPSMEGWGDVQAQQGKLRGAEVCSVSQGIFSDGAQRRLCNGTPADSRNNGQAPIDSNGSSSSRGSRYKKQSSEKPRALANQSDAQASGAWPRCDRCGKPILSEGLGTALKPANEPIVLARKPLERGLTVAENVLKWGCGAINVDASRIGTEQVEKGRAGRQAMQFSERAFANGKGYWGLNGQEEKQTQTGRWPANVLFDEDAAAVLDEQSGTIKSGKPGIKRGGNTGAAYGAESRAAGTQMSGFGDSGGASRFFFVAKQSEYDILPECDADALNAVSTKSQKNAIDSAPDNAQENTQQDCAGKSPSKSIAAPTAENGSQSIQATCKGRRSSAQKSAMPSTASASHYPIAPSVVRFATNIVTHIAQSTVVMRPDQIRELIRSLGSMPDYRKCTQTQSLVSLADEKASIDTTEIIQSLLKLSGCVHHVTAENISLENLESSSGPTRFIYQAKCSKRERNAGLEALEALEAQSTGWSGESMPLRQDGTERKMPRNQNNHPTVKPIKLMQYLIKLITPPGGVVLDPFLGSGSTLCAAASLGFNGIGIEREAEYLEIARKRVEHFSKEAVRLTEGQDGTN